MSITSCQPGGSGGSAAGGGGGPGGGGAAKTVATEGGICVAVIDTGGAEATAAVVGC